MKTVTLTLGECAVDELREELAAAGVRHNPYAEALLPRIPVAPEPRQVAVWVGTASDLGFCAGATLDAVFDGVADRGLAPCPLEVAPLLRLALRGQRVWPRITVASLRPTPLESDPRGFYLRDDEEGSWLRGFVASDDWYFEGGERLALLRTRA